jgi:hypothetical protein
MSSIGYEAIKDLTKKLKRPAQTLIALAPQNDPFYVSPQRQTASQWFRRIWDGLHPGTDVHIRRIHYRLVSQDPPLSNAYGVLLPRFLVFRPQSESERT